MGGTQWRSREANVLHDVDLTTEAMSGKGGAEMIREVATLSIKAGMRNDFESAFRHASPILEAARGYISHEMHKSVEAADRYMVIVQWHSLKEHAVGFRHTVQYEQWNALLEDYFESPPVVEHYVQIPVHLK